MVSAQAPEIPDGRVLPDVGRGVSRHDVGPTAKLLQRIAAHGQAEGFRVRLLPRLKFPSGKIAVRLQAGQRALMAFEEDFRVGPLKRGERRLQRLFARTIVELHLHLGQARHVVITQRIHNQSSPDLPRQGDHVIGGLPIDHRFAIQEIGFAQFHRFRAVVCER